MALAAGVGGSSPEVELWGTKLTHDAGADWLAAALSLLVLALGGAGLTVAVCVGVMLGYHCGEVWVTKHMKKATVVSLPAIGKSSMM